MTHAATHDPTNHAQQPHAPSPVPHALTMPTPEQAQTSPGSPAPGAGSPRHGSNGAGVDPCPSPAPIGAQAGAGAVAQAYYFALTLTGEPLVDALLRAVADAGDSAHHTRDWSDDLTAPIERAARAVAGALAATPAPSVPAAPGDAHPDTARLDWLQAHGEQVVWIDPDSGDASAVALAYSLDGDALERETGGGTIREAIDAAMGGAPAPSAPDAGRAALEAENARLERALTWYADPAQYEEQAPMPGETDGDVPIQGDCGARARAALAPSAGGAP